MGCGVMPIEAVRFKPRRAPVLRITRRRYSGSRSRGRSCNTRFVVLTCLPCLRDETLVRSLREGLTELKLRLPLRRRVRASGAACPACTAAAFMSKRPRSLWQQKTCHHCGAWLTSGVVRVSWADRSHTAAAGAVTVCCRKILVLICRPGDVIALRPLKGDDEDKLLTCSVLSPGTYPKREQFTW